MKLAATAAATAVFLATGIGVLLLSPAPPERIGTPHFSGEGEVGVPPALNKAMPVPPYTEELRVEETGPADIYIYRSRLSGEALARFYTVELAGQGWRAARPPETDVWEEAQIGTDALYFTDGRRLCIINIEETDAFTTHVTLVKTAGIP